MEGFLCYWIGGPIFGGLIPEGAYFWNFTVCVLPIAPFLHKGTTGLGGLYLEGLYMEGLIFGILQYVFFLLLHSCIKGPPSTSGQ